MMSIDTSARLIIVEYLGALGTVTASETPREIFCRVGSVDRREYFAAYNSGFRPEYRVTTDPANYRGEGIIDLDLREGTVRCDVYRTYLKTPDVLELWCAKKNPAATQTVTLWSAGKKVTLFGGYITGTDGNRRIDTGKVATDNVTLVLPQTFQAFCGSQPVAYCRPKAYAAMTAAEKATHFCIDSSAFFALGDITPAANAKFQDINNTYDDVYRVQAVALKNTGKPDTEYLEVIGA